MTLLYNDTFIIFRYRLSQDIIHRGIVIDCRNGGIAFHFDDRGRFGLVQRVLDALVLGRVIRFEVGFGKGIHDDVGSDLVVPRHTGTKARNTTPEGLISRLPGSSRLARVTG